MPAGTKLDITGLYESLFLPICVCVSKRRPMGNGWDDQPRSPHHHFWWLGNLITTIGNVRYLGVFLDTEINYYSNDPENSIPPTKLFGPSKQRVSQQVEQ